MTIRIRTLMSPWREVTEDQARAWVRHMMAHITTSIDREAFLDGRIEGATVRELMA